MPAGGYYDGDRVLAARDRVFSFYQERLGLLPQIEIDPVADYENAVLNIVFRITERPHVMVSDVKISGNHTTHDTVVRHHLTVIPGEPFTVDALEQSVARLRATDLFASVEVAVDDDPLDSSDPPGKVVDVIVEEWDKPGFIEAGGGASSGSGELGYFRIHHPNLDLLRWPRSLTQWDGAFLGGGQSLEFEALPGTKESEYRLRFKEPYFFRSDLSLSLTGEASFLARRSFDEQHWRWSAAVTKSFGESERTKLTLGYVADTVRIDDFEPSAPAIIRRDRGRTFFGYPRATLAWDDTETNFFSGPEGLSLSASIDAAGRATGSQQGFWRTEWNADAFWKPSQVPADFQHLLHLGLSFSAIDGTGDGTHVAERTFPGGPRTFRGFRYRRLGPHVNGEPIGAEAFYHVTARYSFPLGWRELRAMAIVDWGDAESGISELSVERSRVAIGGGLEIRLPRFGTADLFWAHALSRQSGDRSRLFSFALGLTF